MTLLFLIVFMGLLIAGMQLTWVLGGIGDDSRCRTLCCMGTKYMVDNGSMLGWSLVFVPILGMWAVHKYGWEHWEPFDKKHK